jgi:hypothetical protein
MSYVSCSSGHCALNRGEKASNERMIVSRVFASIARLQMTIGRGLLGLFGNLCRNGPKPKALCSLFLARSRDGGTDDIRMNMFSLCSRDRGASLLTLDMIQQPDYAIARGVFVKMVYKSKERPLLKQSSPSSCPGTALLRSAYRTVVD